MAVEDTNKTPQSTLENWDLSGKRVIIRADLNVPLSNGTIFDSFRIEASLPTIRYVLDQGGSATLMTHLGRPDKPSEQLSTRLLMPYLEQRGLSPSFAATPDEARDNTSRLVLLENLRFFPGEKGQDHAFAKELATLGTHYVNDAFGALHRGDSSIALLPELFEPNRRTIGLLVQKELEELTRFFKEPARPICIVLGGAKLSDKIPYLYSLMETVDTILVCPAIAMTFAKASGLDVGRSLVDESSIQVCNNILREAKKHKVKLVFPTDYQVAYSNVDGAIGYEDANALSNNAVAISIGPKTYELFAQEITAAGTVLFNGLFGFLQRRETLDGVSHLLAAMQQTRGASIVAGGEAVAAARMLEKTSGIDWLSTGGGSTLAYICGQELPGLTALDVR